MIHFLPIEHDAIEALILLEGGATPYPWTTQSLSESFEASADCYLIEHQGQSIGYCVMQSVLDEAELLNIVIFKPYQSQGYGAKAIQILKQKLIDSGIKSLFLEVRASNHIAQALYEKMGFEVVSIRQNYYRTENQATEDANVMRCSLKGAPGLRA